MSLQSYTDLLQIVEQGIITPVNTDNVNGASIELHLADTILVEDERGGIVNVAKKQTLRMREEKLNKCYDLMPGEFILASTTEVFNLPDCLVGEYYLKSSMARVGLEHLHAGHCDPGWHGSQLTLELVNLTRHHIIRLTKGMKIGQMVFHLVEPVPDGAGYDVRGQYNGQHGPVSKGVR